MAETEKMRRARYFPKAHLGNAGGACVSRAVFELLEIEKINMGGVVGRIQIQ